MALESGSQTTEEKEGEPQLAEQNPASQSKMYGVRGHYTKV